MSDDWKVGDLAVCVDARTNPVYGPNPLIEGRAYRVIRISAGLVKNKLFGPCPSLWIAGVDSDPCGYAERRFRKIHPDKHEDCEPEFVTLLNRIKRKVSA